MKFDPDNTFPAQLEDGRTIQVTKIPRANQIFQLIDEDGTIYEPDLVRPIIRKLASSDPPGPPATPWEAA